MKANSVKGIGKVNSDKKEMALGSDLKAGNVVKLANSHSVVQGVVDETTADGLAIWIRADLNERRLFHITDGYIVGVQPGGPHRAWCRRRSKFRSSPLPPIDSGCKRLKSQHIRS